MTAPGYWMHETTGVLRPAVQAYLCNDEALTPAHAAALRAYLRQWVAFPWAGELDYLREAVDGLTTREAFDRWLEAAEAEGLDPL